MFERLVEKTRQDATLDATRCFALVWLPRTANNTKAGQTLPFFVFLEESLCLLSRPRRCHSLTQQFCLLVVGEHSILSFWRDDVNYIPKHLNFGPDVTILYNGI